MRRTAIGIAAALALSGCSERPSEAPAAAAPPDQVRAHTLLQLMETIVQPQADIFWNSSGVIINASGEHDLTPTTDQAWLATRSAAATVAEMGNVLLTPRFAEGQGNDWQQFAKSLVEIGLRAEKAAADRDIEAMMETGATMYNVCSACHQVYQASAGEISKAGSESGQ